MSASDDTTAIFMTDTPKQIQKKINKYAFSGGQVSADLHRELCGNPDVDVAYQYLSFFKDDDVFLKECYDKYKSGELRQVKEETVYRDSARIVKASRNAELRWTKRPWTNSWSHISWFGAKRKDLSHLSQKLSKKRSK